ncbi:Sulfhydrylase FUB7 [Lachnellula hyalina]|uniref:Sulfhydrylase FUB7 n=1 Tax=Lachnellula hyalina TaxID=1316788 RepID=A0A8H8QTD1_9HELO|nr:Sulfhydrylase FUB7 [Lachnellula hyalina]TVY22394.1 Sulfhydrylase FUB7 [Lachnellula hyalina]
MTEPNLPKDPEPEQRSFQFETSGVHAGLNRSENGVQDAPIYASTSFVFDNSAHGAAIFGMTADAFCYSRIANPTVDVFETRMAALENGAAALAAASGQAALFMTITALAQAGDNIVIASHACDVSKTIFKNRLPPFGITVRFVESGDVDCIRQAIDGNTKGVFVESISSTDLLVSDISTLAVVAHNAGVPLIVDNTAGAGGFLLRPLDHGADIIVESAAEWLGISGSNAAGVIIDSGKFDWVKNQARFPQFFEQAPGFHGLRLWEKFGNLVFISFARIAVLRDMGPCLNPFEAFQLLAGLETLSVRLERISSNAAKLATWLESDNRVEEVRYPGLQTNPSYNLSKKYCPRGYGGLLSIKLKSAKDLVWTKSKVVSFGASIGGSKTIIVKREQPHEDQRQAGSIYVSIGLENIDDIISDFKEVLESV